MVRIKKNYLSKTKVCLQKFDFSCSQKSQLFFGKGKLPRRGRRHPGHAGAILPLSPRHINTRKPVREEAGDQQEPAEHREGAEGHA